ncbi:VOC family protein [Hydrogenophaga borbori]|jgi:2,3-dihydroxy-p-cumate/2,3-dihydroxybenzoate 3,4-dioxygenase
MSVPFRYRKLGYVALNVSDTERSGRFYTDIVGLDVAPSAPDGPVFLRCGSDHHNIVLYPAGGPGLKRVAFELESAADLKAAREHLKGLGLEVEEVSPQECALLKQGETLRFVEPNSGLTFEFYSRMMQMAIPYGARLAQIVRLGHMVISVQQYDQMVAFLTQKLGFAVSDFVEGAFAFLRAHPNPLHHTFAVGRSAGGNHLHHVNFMVSDIDDIGCAVNRLEKSGTKIVFGPGRHMPSGSIFLYFLDPDGMTVEYSFGMEEFPEDLPREARMLEPRPEALDTWGSVPKPEFAKVGPIEQKVSA